MSIQSQFDDRALRMLPKVYQEIKQAEQHEKNQITFIVLNKINNLSNCLDSLNQEEIKRLDCSLISSLKFKGLI